MKFSVTEQTKSASVELVCSTQLNKEFQIEAIATTSVSFRIFSYSPFQIELNIYNALAVCFELVVCKTTRGEKSDGFWFWWSFSILCMF